MKAEFFSEPVPHLVIDDFFDDFEYVSSLAESLYYLSDLGSHGEYEEKPITKRNEFYLYEMYSEAKVKELVDIMTKHLWREETRKIYESTPYPFPMLNATSYDGMLLGYYGEGGHYRMHADTCFISSVVFMHKEKKFEGGDFILTNTMKPFMTKEFASTKIESIPNRAVFFPSCYHHGVASMRTPDDSISSMRISLAGFMGFDNR